jgi:hypothetical protein
MLKKMEYEATNHGKTARRVLKNPMTSTEITGVEEELIHCFGSTLKVLSSGDYISFDNFSMCYMTTAEMFIGLFHWFHMPPKIYNNLHHRSTQERTYFPFVRCPTKILKR